MSWKTFFSHTRALAESRRKLLAAIGAPDDLAFVRSHGNIGDDLIYAGTRQLLAGLQYREIPFKEIEQARGHTALLAGSGAWCQAYHDWLPGTLSLLEQRFERVIVLPSSFDTSVEIVRETLAGTRALVFARERTSYEQIRGLCQADIAHDGSFFFDYRPYRLPRRHTRGVLRAYRSDHERQGFPAPEDSNDISLTCQTLDEWLWTIARAAAVETDRAHVMIAAALLGKRVDYRASNYHKVPAIAEFALQGFPVYRQPVDIAAGIAAHTMAHAS